MTIDELEQNGKAEIGDCFLIVRVASCPTYGTEHLESGDRIIYKGMNAIDLPSYSVQGTDKELCLSGDMIVEKCSGESN